VDIYLAGGPFLHPLLLLAVCTILLAFTACGLFAPRTGPQIPPGFVKRAGPHWKPGDVKNFGIMARRRAGCSVVCRAMAERWETSTPRGHRSALRGGRGQSINRLRTPVKTLT